MQRRTFLRHLTALTALPFININAHPSIAISGTNGWLFSVNIPQMIAAGAVQLCPQWCWATSISMIFAFHGHPVSQQRIVAETYGNIVCLPAYTPITIAQNLSRVWVDDHGQQFSSQIIAAYDSYNHISMINNNIIINELQSNRPLLYCNTHHAMVVCSVQISQTPFGPQITNVDVVDPWPNSAGIHPLTAAEATMASIGGQMTFLAAVLVS